MENQENDSELKLIFPTMDYKEQIEEYLKEFIDNGEYEIAGDGGLDRIKDCDEWLKKVQNDLSIETIDKDRIPATLYLTVRKSDNRVVGNLQIRHILNEKLLYYGGHIGDSIRPSERNKGYGTEQIRLALKEAKKLGINRVMMSSDKDNVASAKTIMNNNGILEDEHLLEDGETLQRYWINLKRKYANNMSRRDYVENAIHKCKFFESKEFTGDVYYTKFIDVEKLVTSNGICFKDNNYEWISFFDYNSKVCLTALYDDKNDIIEWYFDIANYIGKKDGIPFEEDMFLDVVITKNKEILLIDEDELQEALDKFEINQKDYDEVYKTARGLMQKLNGNVDKVSDFTKKYLKIMEEI